MHVVVRISFSRHFPEIWHIIRHLKHLVKSKQPANLRSSCMLGEEDISWKHSASSMLINSDAEVFYFNFSFMLKFWKIPRSAFPCLVNSLSVSSFRFFRPNFLYLCLSLPDPNIWILEMQILLGEKTEFLFIFSFYQKAIAWIPGISLMCSDSPPLVIQRREVTGQFVWPCPDLLLFTLMSSSAVNLVPSLLAHSILYYNPCYLSCFFCIFIFHWQTLHVCHLDGLLWNISLLYKLWNNRVRWTPITFWSEAVASFQPTILSLFTSLYLSNILDLTIL